MNVDYPSVLDEIKLELIEGRTASHAFLLWFLKNYYRLDDVDAADAVCDGPDDRGIDGVYVDKNVETVDIFQCKLVQNPGKTLGDTQLKQFVGTLHQVKNGTGVEDIASSTSNRELGNLLRNQNVAQLIQDGYEVRGVFVTNAVADENANRYLVQYGNMISLFDKKFLEASFVHTRPSSPVGKPVTFDVHGYDCIECNVEKGVRAIFAPVKAIDLTLLDGIASSELFSWNVRGSLGRTEVNKDIMRSLENVSEHKEFILYHNGLTLLCENLDIEGDRIIVSGYSVVNGCQSLTSFYENRHRLTEDLRLVVRIIELPPGTQLADKITHHTNNQNPINARDLQSNSVIQRRLQNEFQKCYGDEVFYRIKRGEADKAQLNIDNDEAGRLLLAFDLKQPWACHQSYKVLDELHSEIYARPEVDAHRIVAVYEIAERVNQALTNIDNQMLASYRLAQYFMLYLTRLAIELDEVGKAFCRSPSSFINCPGGRARLRQSIGPVVGDLVIDLNAELRERLEAGNPFDYKRELKSPNSVRDIQRGIISNYHKSVARKRVSSFGDEWQNLSN